MKMMIHQSFVVLQTMNLWWSPKIFRENDFTEKTKLQLPFFFTRETSEKTGIQVITYINKPNYKFKLFHIEEEKRKNIISFTIHYLSTTTIYLDVTFIYIILEKNKAVNFQNYYRRNYLLLFVLKFVSFRKLKIKEYYYYILKYMQKT